jgi:hypothetical protein
MIRQLARYEIRSEALPRCFAAIQEFVAYVRASILYPECLARVEFIDYTQVAANVDPWGR